MRSPTCTRRGVLPSGTDGGAAGGSGHGADRAGNHQAGGRSSEPAGGGALGGAALVARAWPRMFEAMVCYAGDVAAAPPLEELCPSR